MKLRCFFAAGLLAGAGAFAQTGPQPAASLPQDHHDGMTISADAYLDPGRAKEKLGKVDPFPEGILPIEVFMKNETDQPIKVNLDTIQLEVRSGTQHQDIDSLPPTEVASAIAHPNGTPNPGLRRFPIGANIPKDEKRDKALDALRPVVLNSDIVPPHGTIHGFIFFDVGRNNMPALAKASLYLPDLSVATTNAPLMFFEVMLGKPDSAQQ